MSNPEILAMLDARKPGEEVRVSMSKAGVFLTVGEASSEITEDQAAWLWEFLPLLMSATV
jgi:hypothetical protein